jgi:hypothetical protein
MKRILLSSIVVWIYSATTIFAQPQINNLSGVVVNEGSISITGTAFGANSLNIEWLGGSNGNIEEGVGGDPFSKAGWTPAANTVASLSPLYTTSKSYSGTKSIIFPYDNEGHYKSDLTYGDGTELSEFYITWWTYFAPSIFDGQWKIWRLMPIPSSVNDDDSPQFYHRATDGALSSTVVHCRPLVDSSTNLWRVTGEDDYNNVHYLDYGKSWPGNDQWARIELYIKASTLGSSDGSFILTIHRPDAGIDTPGNANYDGNLMTYSSDQTERFKYFVFQNYLGNATQNDGNQRVYIDDVFIQKGTRARIEIGDSAVWSNCTHREIQIPTAWADGSITITVNQGSFEPCNTYYLFVIDADGNVSDQDLGTPGSQGYPIKIVTGKDGRAPCPRTEIQIINQVKH